MPEKYPLEIVSFDLGNSYELKEDISNYFKWQRQLGCKWLWYLGFKTIL